MWGRNDDYGVGQGAPAAVPGLPALSELPSQGPPLMLNAKQLTAAIKNATTPERLAQLAEVHSA
jgi:hypothetical protein